MLKFRLEMRRLTRSLNGRLPLFLFPPLGYQTPAPEMYTDALAQSLKRLHQLRVLNAQMHSERDHLVINSALDVFESNPEHCELKVRFRLCHVFRPLLMMG